MADIQEDKTADRMRVLKGRMKTTTTTTTTTTTMTNAIRPA